MTYTVHPDALFDPGAPVLGSTHLEARDNLIAVADGDPGAPRIDPIAAMAHEGVAGAIGTYVFATTNPSGNYNLGDTISGSNLYPTGGMYTVSVNTGGTSNTDNAGLGAALTGTWRCMGRRITLGGSGSDAVTSDHGTLWLRIA